MTIKNRSQWYVFTGGPGSGKTSVLDVFKALGHVCAPEVGRAIIQQQVQQGGNALSWGNKVAFRDAMLAQDKQLHQYYSGLNENVFFDRSIIDTLGYSRLENLPIDERLLEDCHCYQYAKTVFIFPPWKEIFVNDSERKQDFTQAVATYEVMKQTYQQFGYQLVEVPKATVEHRVAFILSKLCD